MPRSLPSPAACSQPRSLFDGLLTRVISCELQYGPMNCDFAWHGTNQPIFDELTLPPVRGGQGLVWGQPRLPRPSCTAVTGFSWRLALLCAAERRRHCCHLQVMGCGLNMPSPDLLTPVRAAATIWTWAPGHPYDTSDQRQEASLAAALRRKAGGHSAGSTAAANCGVLSASDARWRAVPCGLAALPSACRQQNTSLSAPDGGWVLNSTLPRGSCLPGSQYDLPRHPRENYLLAAALQRAGHEAAWLPVHGPEWSTAGWPAGRQQPQPTDTRHILLHAALPAAGVLAATALVTTSLALGRRALLRRRNPHLYQALGATA